LSNKYYVAFVHKHHTMKAYRSCRQNAPHNLC